MKLKDIIKKQTLLIIVTVVAVVSTTIGVSYAVFFDVKKNNKDQEVTAGILRVKLSNFEALDLNEPYDETTGLTTTPPVTYTIQNTDSNLPARYTIAIYANPANTIPLNTIRVSTDGTTSAILTTKECIKGEDGNCKPAADNPNSYYWIIDSSEDSGAVPAGQSSASKSIRVWVDSNALGDGIEATVDLNLYIESEVDETSATAGASVE